MKTGKYFLLTLFLVLFGLSVWGPARAADPPATANPQALVSWERTTTERLIPQTQPLAPAPSKLVASAGRRYCAYVVGVKNQFKVVWDGVDGKASDAVVELCFSPDGQQLAYVAREGKWRRVVVVGKKEGPLYDKVLEGSLRFSPDSQGPIYVAGDASQEFVVANGIEGKRYDAIYAEPLQSSPDSQGLLYVASDDSQKFVVANGIEGKRYDAIYNVTPIQEGSGTEAAFGVRYMAVSGGQVFSVTERLK